MLRIDGLNVQTRDATLIYDLDFSVEDGEIMAVLGPSGAGKTTLLRVIAGLVTPTRGSVTWDGASLADVPPHRRGFGLMFQDFALFPHRSVAGNVEFGLRMQHASPNEVRRRVAEVLEWVGLSGYEQRRIGSLSGGEQQRVALARALAPAPRLLMLDEPIGSLDRTLRERLIVELRQLLVEHSITAVYVTHDQEEAFTLADRVTVMREGRIVQVGRPEQVWQRPADEWTARFLGFTNIVDADCRGDEAVTAFGTIPIDPPVTGRRRMILRSDALHQDGAGAISGVVVARAFQGGYYRIGVRVDGGPVLDAQVGGSAPQIGERISLGLEPGGVVVLPG
jgi:thiamine transport system ATP-binding protein